MSRLDDAFARWEDEYDWPTLKGRKARSRRGERQAGAGQKPSGGTVLRNKLQRVVKRVPEVMVKITGNGKSMSHIKAHMDYIARYGELSVEDQDGNSYLGKEDMLDLRDSWAMGRLGIPEEPQDGEGRKESYNIVLSMPAGTSYRGLEAAARTFAADEFSTRQYAFAVHDDKDHTHVHLVVKSADARGRRLNPRKADLRRWREHFAERLRERGIEANASPRIARGVVHRPEKQAVRGVRSRGEAPNRDIEQHSQALAEAQGKSKNLGAAEAHEAIIVNRKRMIAIYEACARELVKGGPDDKALAMDIVRFVKTLPPAKTKHELRVEQLRAGGVQQHRSGVSERAQEPRPNQDRGKA